jgi:hypothetical protein
VEIKITIETWNGKWRFEIEDKEFGDRVQSGERETFTACAADCLAFVAENAAQPLRAPDLGWVCGECEFTNLEVDTVCQLCTASRPKRVI